MENFRYSLLRSRMHWSKFILGLIKFQRILQHMEFLRMVKFSKLSSMIQLSRQPTGPYMFNILSVHTLQKSEPKPKPIGGQRKMPTLSKINSSQHQLTFNHGSIATLLYNATILHLLWDLILNVAKELPLMAYLIKMVTNSASQQVSKTNK